MGLSRSAEVFAKGLTVWIHGCTGYGRRAFRRLLPALAKCIRAHLHLHQEQSMVNKLVVFESAILTSPRAGAGTHSPPSPGPTYEAGSKPAEVLYQLAMSGRPSIHARHGKVIVLLPSSSVRILADAGAWLPEI
ncbi:unnamed protein product [Peniophora sp. CBMAI 1063]|nr:unnamed protein product [Peniophora sp. CBMAI 1063]